MRSIFAKRFDFLMDNYNILLRILLQCLKFKMYRKNNSTFKLILIFSLLSSFGRFIIVTSLAIGLPKTFKSLNSKLQLTLIKSANQMVFIHPSTSINSLRPSDTFMHQ